MAGSNFSDTMLSHLYTKNAKIWVRDEEIVWRPAELGEDYKNQKELNVNTFEKGYFSNTGGTRGNNLPPGRDESLEEKIPIKEKSDLPHLRDPNLIKDNNLTSLNYLNEPEVLHTLQVLFIDKNIFYTYCGIALVAINPYQDVDIYDEATLEIYRYQNTLKNLDPHIYAVAAEAYNQMTRFKRNQSIIVSGESGAGKTVSAKHTMHYFARVGGSTKTTIHDKVLASNPIMESFGNAKTIRNDNSSRFGKYIQIAFGAQNYIIGANMKTYLLEKSRVVFQAYNERNYHIFYQLCASADCPELKPFKLSHQDEFYYTQQGESPHIQDIEDADVFIKTRSAFTELGVNEEDQMKMFGVVSAILHLGNIIFEPGEDETTCDVAKGNPHFDIVCDLLLLNREEMQMWLCNRQITSGSDCIIKPLTAKEVISDCSPTTVGIPWSLSDNKSPQISSILNLFSIATANNLAISQQLFTIDFSLAVYGRDALAKHIYARIFAWIAAKINSNLLTHEDTQNFIGVLDIYGFETFEINSFEQFCINYANERLQLQFNTHVFTLEQQEYRKEELEWNEISHYDNTPCIDLIESPHGILALLDDECKMLSGNYTKWCTTLYDKLSETKCFEKPRTSQTSFTVCHFAEKVTYICQDFMKKNLDTVSDLQVETLKESSNPFVRELFQEKKPERKLSTILEESYFNQSKKSKKHKQTVGSQFKESLNSLMKTLSSTNPHYVRCIKPNDDKKPFKFNCKRVVEQLRACGVLETIRISAAGFPARETYENILNMFQQLLAVKEIKKSDVKLSCKRLMQNYIEDTGKYRFGKTKIFFRAGQLALLDKLLTDRRIRWSVIVQKQVRALLCKRRFNKIRCSIFFLQVFGRGYLARLAFQDRRREHAATSIQAYFRGYQCRKIYQQKRSAVIVVQRYARKTLAKKLFRQLMEDRKATIIQTQVRAYLARNKFKKLRHGIVLLQSHVRRRAVKNIYKELKRKAKDTDELKLSNQKLCNKIIELSNTLKERTLSSKSGEEISVTIGQDIILELRETVRKQAEQIRKLRKTLKAYAHKLNDGDAAEIAAELARDEQESFGVMAAIKHQEREYLGMLEYNKVDENALIKNLIHDLQPYVAESMLPGLPAYIIFMCIRHTDHINDDQKVCTLLTAVVYGIKRVVMKSNNDIEKMTLWLANACRLLNNLKQYSGEKRYQTSNTPKQNRHCLRNFDLSEYRPVFNDLCVYNYRQLIKTMKENIDKLIVPAILEYEACAGLNKDDYRGHVPTTETDALDRLQKLMCQHIGVLRNHAVDPEVITLIVKQLFYYMNGKALNNLLLRRDMCNWNKGAQIRYNISHLEQWLREYHLQDSEAFSMMEPLIQASQLLQARKTDADVESVCQMCPKLKTAQIIKILNQYTPVRGYEDDTVAISFILLVQQKLSETREADMGTSLLMDTQYVFPVTFTFKPSSIALERVSVPEILYLGFLERI